MGSIYRTYPLPLPKCSSVPYRRTPDSSGVTQADDNNTATYGKLNRDSRRISHKQLISYFTPHEHNLNFLSSYHSKSQYLSMNPISDRDSELPKRGNTPSNSTQASTITYFFDPNWNNPTSNLQLKGIKKRVRLDSFISTKSIQLSALLINYRNFGCSWAGR